MTRKGNIRIGIFTLVLVLVVLLIFRIGRGDRVHFEMCGFDEKWTIYRPDFSSDTYIIPNVYQNTKAPTDNFLKVDIKGGIVPMNILTIYSPFDPESTNIVFYNYDIYENKLDSSLFRITEEYWKLKSDSLGCASSVELLEII